MFAWLKAKAQKLGPVGQIVTVGIGAGIGSLFEQTSVDAVVSTFTTTLAAKGVWGAAGAAAILAMFKATKATPQ